MISHRKSGHWTQRYFKLCKYHRKNSSANVRTGLLGLLSTSTAKYLVLWRRVFKQFFTCNAREIFNTISLRGIVVSLEGSDRCIFGLCSATFLLESEAAEASASSVVCALQSRFFLLGDFNVLWSLKEELPDNL